MVEKSCSRSHGQPLPGVRSAAMISMRRAISEEGFMGHLGGKRAATDGRVDKPTQLADGLAYVHGAMLIEMIARSIGASLGMDRRSRHRRRDTDDVVRPCH